MLKYFNCNLLFMGADGVDLEFGVTTPAPYIGVPLKDLKLKSGILLAGIVRQNGQIIIPSGDDVLNLHDDVIVVTKDTSLRDIGDILQ